MAAWPSSLPTLRLPVTYGMQDGVARFQTDIGPPQTRLLTTANPEPFSHRVQFTAAQLGTFVTFWKTTISNGALPFDLDMPAPISATKSVLFTVTPVFAKQGKHYVADFSLLILAE